MIRGARTKWSSLFTFDSFNGHTRCWRTAMSITGRTRSTWRARENYMKRNLIFPKCCWRITWNAYDDLGWSAQNKSSNEKVRFDRIIILVTRWCPRQAALMSAASRGVEHSSPWFWTSEPPHRNLRFCAAQKVKDSAETKPSQRKRADIWRRKSLS